MGHREGWAGQLHVGGQGDHLEKVSLGMSLQGWINLSGIRGKRHSGQKESHRQSMEM